MVLCYRYQMSSNTGISGTTMTTHALRRRPPPRARRVPALEPRSGQAAGARHSGRAAAARGRPAPRGGRADRRHQRHLVHLAGAGATDQPVGPCPRRPWREPFGSILRDVLISSSLPVQISGRPRFNSNPRLERATRSRRFRGLAPHPAYVTNARFDILAWNEPAVRLLGDFGATRRRSANLIHLLFIDPAWRSLFADWRDVAQMTVAQFRASTARLSSDPEFSEIRHGGRARQCGFCHALAIARGRGSRSPGRSGCITLRQGGWLSTSRAFTPTARMTTSVSRSTRRPTPTPPSGLPRSSRPSPTRARRATPEGRRSHRPRRTGSSRELRRIVSSAGRASRRWFRAGEARGPRNRDRRRPFSRQRRRSAHGPGRNPAPARLRDRNR